MLRALPVRLFGFLSILSLASSCASYHDLVNFNDTELPEGGPQAIANASPLLVQENDLLRITVSSADLLASAPFNNEPAEGGNTPQGQIQRQTLELFSGYYVDEDGFIDFPVIGQVQVTGKTLEEVKGYLRAEIERYLKEPVVTVRFINFKVTVLGSVQRPGVVRASNPRLTLLEALGEVGDLTDYADRSEILVVREGEGERSYEYLDLHSDEIFGSPYFYLKQNDLIYVRPNSTRTAAVAERGQRVAQYGTVVLAAATLVATILNNNRNRGD